MIDRSFEGRMKGIRADITELQRRLGRLPDRLSITGREVTDYNLAMDPGWYWGYQALNQPAGDNYWAVETSALVNGNTIFQRADRLGAPDGVERWRYTKNNGTTWSDWSPSQGPEVWVDLQGYLATGITYTADGASDLAGIRARRVGPMVELSLGNIRIDSISVPVSGNIANRHLLTGIPAQFRPKGGAAISSMWSGRIWSGYVRGTDGSVQVAAIQPDANQTGTVTFTNETLSGHAVYPADTP